MVTSGPCTAPARRNRRRCVMPPLREGGEALEGFRLRAPVAEVGIGDVEVAPGVGEAVGRDVHDALGVLERQAAEEDGVDEREDGRVDADSQGQRGHHDRGKSRLAAQHAEAVLHVLPEAHTQDRRDSHAQSSLAIMFGTS